MTEQQAYLAIYEFLEARYQRGPSDELGSLPGSLALLPNVSPVDAAMATEMSCASCRARWPVPV